MAHIGFERCPVVIPYYGGKWELSKQLVPMIPPHSRYVEMFAGGLSMYFRKQKVDINLLYHYQDHSVYLYLFLYF